MVAGAQQQPQSQQQTQQTTPSAQDEALKRNTDCVYFLASPLTCKKGSECEYRHSEYARVNPRDCWYWLNGNCLNPKCSFRHPPLDGLLVPQAATAGGQPAPLSQIATTSATHAAYNSSKQAVPCIFFQKGLCLKGDKCAFLHGPNPNTGNKVPQVQVTNQGTEPPSFKKVFGGLEKCMQEKNNSQANVAKSVAGTEAKPAQKVGTASQRNVVGMERYAPTPPMGFDNESSRLKVTNTPPITNGTSVARSNRMHQAHVSDDHSFHNGKESDEFLRESSPGFDVLVADELRNSDYYNREDQFGKARGQDGMNLDSVNEYSLGHSVDYKSVADIERERFCGPKGYDSYDHVQETYVWDLHRNSADIFRAPSHLERRTQRRSGSPESAEVSDLRHHLSKRRRFNGLKSVVSHDYPLESHVDEQSRKDSLQLPLNESSLSNRFRGRIKLPANGDDHLERESDRGRNRSTLSPGTMQTRHQGRFRDRLRGRAQDDFERKNFRDRPMRREIAGDGNTDFAGPKSLAELRTRRSPEYKEQQSLGKRKSLKEQQQTEDDFLFEGPKPLNEILKEKRAAGAEVASKSGKSSENKGDSVDREIKNGSENTAFKDTQNGTSPVIKEDVKNHMLVNEGEPNFQVTDGVGRHGNKTDVTHGPSSEDGMIYDEAIEDQEFEGDEQKDGNYDYEQVDEGDYNFDEGENPEQEEYMDDEDGDDFAKKIGVMLT